MTGFKHILVPTDFEEAANHALDMAVLLAQRFEAKVTVLHSTSLPSSALPAYAAGIYFPTEEMLSAAQNELEATLSRAKARYPNIHGVVVQTEPYVAILEFAKENSADLIVMGTHGRRWLSRVFLGSVADRVVRFSPIPVLTVTAKAQEKAKE